MTEASIYQIGEKLLSLKNLKLQEFSFLFNNDR